MKKKNVYDFNTFVNEDINADEREILRTEYFVKFIILYGVPIIEKCELNVIKTTRRKQYGMVRINTTEQPLNTFLHDKYGYSSVPLSKEDAREILLKFNYIEVSEPINIYNIDINKYRNILTDEWLKAYDSWKYKNENL